MKCRICKNLEASFLNLELCGNCKEGYDEGIERAVDAYLELLSEMPLDKCPTPLQLYIRAKKLTSKYV